MINTLNIKQQQLRKGFFTVGSGREVVLIMGSCRVAPYVNYFNDWNLANGNRFTIHSIDPFNWNWDINDDRVEYIETLGGLENDERLLNMLASVDIFIHEWYQNAGMFNVNKGDAKTIYYFGMNPKQDICLPNWNDVFVLTGDIVTFDIEIRKKAAQDYNVIGKLSPQTIGKIQKVAAGNLQKFYNVCHLSSIPEMGEYFRENYLKERFWWSYNHVSKNFTLAVWHFMNDNFLHLDLSKGFDENHQDMFANNFTRLTEYDTQFNWGEEITPLKL